MKCRIAKASLFALLCVGLVHAAPTGSSLYQLTLAKVQGVLTGTKTSSNFVDGSGNCRLLASTDMPYYPQVALTNGTTYAIMATEGRSGILDIVEAEGSGQYAKIRLTPAGCIVAADSTAAFVVSSTPTTTQVGVNVTSGNFTVKTGPGFTPTNMTFIYRGI